ncbi:MAG: MFS transporter [Myxococcales bacterium]|nr:MFS transporter [Myxococcales bacterium]MCB9644610.1 MFS transporter [Myxococcales bacterium]
MTQQATAPTSSNKRILLIAFMTIFLDLLGFGIIIPIQPFYAEAFGARPFTVTLLGASYSAMQFIFAPIWGRLSDRVGRRPIILMSITLNALGFLLFGFAGGLGMLFAARMLSGLGGANIGAIQAVIADSTPPSERAKGMGIIGAAFGLGFIFGPAIGGTLGQISPQMPAFFACGVGVINLLLALRLLPETRPPQEDLLPRRRFSLESWKESIQLPNVLWLFLLYFAITTGFSMMEQIFGLYIDRIWLSDQTFAHASERVKRAAALTAYVMVAVGVVASIVQGGLIGKLTHRFGERRLLFAGTSTLAFAFVFLIIVGHLKIFGLMMLAGGFMALGSGLSNPSLSSFLSRNAPPDRQGTILGQGQSLSALGRVIGPAMAGLLFEWHINVPFMVSAVMMVVCVFLVTRLSASSTH